MKKIVPVLITIILIGVAGWGVYLLATKSGTTSTDNGDSDADDSGTTNDYSYITNFDQCESAGFPVQESYPRRCSTPDGSTFTEVLDDDALTPDDTDNTDNTDTGDSADDDEPITSDTAYTLSALSAEAGAEAGQYRVSVKVTTAGGSEAYAQGYTYSWKVDASTAFSKERTSVSAGEYTHSATIKTTRSNPTIKFVLTDPYTTETVEISALLQDLLAE